MTTTPDNGGQPAAEPTPAPDHETGRAQGHTPDPDPSDKLAQSQDSPAAPQPEQAPVEEDVDAIALANARKALEDEEKTGQQPEPTPAAPQPTAQQQPQAPTPAAPQQRPVMVPKARLDEVLSKSDENARAAAYWQGRAEEALARQGQAPTGQPPAPQAPAQTPEQQIAALRAERLALLKKFDGGETGMVDIQPRLDEIEDQVTGLRLIMLQPKAPARQQQQEPQVREESLSSQRAAADLERDHPYSLHIKDKEDWELIETKARKQLAADPEFTQAPPGEYRDFLLRKRMAELTDVYGPSMTGKTREQIAPKAPNGQQPSSPTQQPGLTPQAQRTLAKLTQAAAAPPNINAVGTATTGSGIPTDDEIAVMSEEQLDALPHATKTAIRQRMADSFG